MSRELNGEINADNTFKEWTVTNLLSSPAVAETHPKIHVKLAPHLRKVRFKAADTCELSCNYITWLHKLRTNRIG